MVRGGDLATASSRQIHLNLGRNKRGANTICESLKHEVKMNKHLLLSEMKANLLFIREYGKRGRLICALFKLLSAAFQSNVQSGSLGVGVGSWVICAELSDLPQKSHLKYLPVLCFWWRLQ